MLVASVFTAISPVPTQSVSANSGSSYHGHDLVVNLPHLEFLLSGTTAAHPFPVIKRDD